MISCKVLFEGSYTWLIIQKRDPGIIIDGNDNNNNLYFWNHQLNVYCHLDNKVDSVIFVPVWKYDAPKSWVIFVVQVVIFHKGIDKLERA